MKALKNLGVLAVAAYVVLALGACSKTSNDAATTPGTCTMTANGQMVDAYGRYCNSSSLTYCQGYQYINGQYINPTTGQVGNCGTGNVIPSQGYYGGSYIGGGTDGCALWSQLYYPTTYVPINVGGGSIMCVNFAYVQGYASQYNQAYANPQYWYYYPPSMYACDPYYGCGGGGYGAGGYYGGGYYGGGYYGYNQCATNLNLGFSTITSGGTGIGIGTNLCFPPSY